MNTRSYYLSCLFFIGYWLVGCQSLNETVPVGQITPTITTGVNTTVTQSSEATALTTPTVTLPTLTPTNSLEPTIPATDTPPATQTLTGGLHNITPVAEVNGLFSLQWADDGQSLIYATGNEQWPSHVQTLPVYQNWWLYDVVSGDKQALPPPQTRVTNAVRESLEICPFPLPEIVPYPYACSVNLRESPTHNRIVFSSSQLDDTWLANIDGTDAVYLDKLWDSPNDVLWSSDDQWLLIGLLVARNDYYLVSSDGTFVESLEELTDTSHAWVEGPTPQFSPDGQKVAFVGIETGGRQLTGEQLNQEDAYGLYVLDLGTLEYQLVSTRFGLFQWSRDSAGLYVLDGSANTVGSITTVRQVRYTDLYYIDLTQASYPEQELASGIPIYPSFSSAWAYSPEAHAIAGTFDVHNAILSIMTLD